MHPKKVLINRRKTLNIQKCEAPIHAQNSGPCKPAFREQTAVKASIEGEDAGTLHGNMENVPHVKRGLHRGVHLRQPQRHHRDEDQRWTDKKSQAPGAIVRQVFVTQEKAKARDVVWYGNQVYGCNKDVQALW